MRRFFALLCLIGLALPAGISISGCVRNPAGNYCNGLGYGLKNTDVASIVLQPQLGGISLAYGQTFQVLPPSAFTCKGENTSVSSSRFTYGTSNNQLADIAPNGSLCAGTWNRNTGGGIADYTYCNPPSLPKGLPYSTAYLTATADSVTSNPIEVFVHAPVTALSLVTTPLSSSSQQQCFSQNQKAELDTQACYAVTDSNGVTHQYEFCAPSSVTSANYACTGGLAPGVSSVPTCASSIGTLNFAASNAAVARIAPGTSTDPLSTITALLPGTTSVTATIAQSSSSAGYFSTCPPASISIALANGSTSGVVTQGVSQNLTSTVVDTQGNPITGLNLAYESTNPLDLSVQAGSAISANFPGSASIYAVCAPPACNQAPTNEFGLNGTGLSLSSNPVSITVPGTTSDFVWFAAPGQSQYFASMQLLNGNPGLTVRLPYVPNSMVMDQLGTNLYFGSSRELMVYTTNNNSLSKQDLGAPGVVLAVSPNGNNLLINDQIRGLFYLYDTSTSVSTTFGGMGVAASWTPDSETLYIVDSAAANNLPQNVAAGISSHTSKLYVYNPNVGWSTYDLSASGGSESLAIMVPALGAYLSGNISTVAHAWCPTGTVGNNATIQYYPQSDPAAGSTLPPTSVVSATSDGAHILGASLLGASITLEDIGLNIPSSPLCPEQTTGTAPNLVQTLGKPTPFSTNPTPNVPANLNAVTNAASAFNSSIPCVQCMQVVTGAAPTTASASSAAPIAFVTYYPETGVTPAQSRLPFYLPQASGAGSVGYVTLNENSFKTPPPAATAPIAGAFSPDNSFFFVSTAGDNAVHFISIPANLSTSVPPTDAQQFSPSLPACTPVSEGGADPGCLYPTTLPTPTPTTYVPATAITVKPRGVS